MATIGAVITEFRANAAQFLQETGKVSSANEKVGKTAAVSQRQMANYASQGIGAIIPAAAGAESQIAQLIAGITKANGALALLGKGLLAVGAFAFGVQLGTKIREEIDNWLALGETVNQTTERMKKEAEEQKKFADERARSVALLLNLEKQRRAAESAAVVEGFKQFDPVAAAAEQREAALAAAEDDRKLRERNIVETIRDEGRRRQALIESARLTGAERLKVEREYHNTVAKLNQDAADLAKKTYIDQTTALFEQLQKRIELAKTIQVNANRAAQIQGFGDLFAPFLEAEETKRDMASIAEGFALLLADGKRWADVAPEIFRVNAELERRGFFGLLTAVDQARTRFEQLRVGQKDLATDTENLRMAIDRLPASMQASDPAVVAFTQKLAAMEEQSLRTALAIQQLALTIATTTPPPVTAAGQFEVGAAVP
jgi:nucleotide-binding universal stress UspA family protein